MTIQFEQYKTFPCVASKFKINGIEAFVDDFGVVHDVGDGFECEYEDIVKWGCIDLQFDRKDLTTEVLNLYKINKKEYDEVCDLLTEKLNIGMCGWCV